MFNSRHSGLRASSTSRPKDIAAACGIFFCFSLIFFLTHSRDTELAGKSILAGSERRHANCGGAWDGAGQPRMLSYPDREKPQDFPVRACIPNQKSSKFLHCKDVSNSLVVPHATFPLYRNRSVCPAARTGQDRSTSTYISYSIPMGLVFAESHGAHGKPTSRSSSDDQLFAVKDDEWKTIVHRQRRRMGKRQSFVVKDDKWENAGPSCR